MLWWSFQAQNLSYKPITIKLFSEIVILCLNLLRYIMIITVNMQRKNMIMILEKLVNIMNEMF